MKKKQLALLETHTLWLALAILEENGVYYIGNETSKINLAPEYLHNCPCCQYVHDKVNAKDKDMDYDDCKKHCPMIAFWPQGCEEEYSTYDRWENGEPGCAKKISEAALDLYKEGNYE